MIDAIHTGVIINNIAYNSPAHKKLLPGDIMTKINGYNVDYDGTMKLSDVVVNFQQKFGIKNLQIK